MRLFAAAGHDLAVLFLSKPHAEVVALSDGALGSKYALVTEDFTEEAGSYNGVNTRLVSAAGHHIVVAEAAEANSGALVPIVLPKTLKADWKTVPGQILPDILKVSCEPDLASSSSFVTTYSRYQFIDAHWTIRRQRVAEFWENEDNSFPEESRFPAP